MGILNIKSLLTSLCQREAIFPSLAKRGEGRFDNNVTLLMTALVCNNYYFSVFKNTSADSVV
jgi:hypothetical protein